MPKRVKMVRRTSGGPIPQGYPTEAASLGPMTAVRVEKVLTDGVTTAGQLQVFDEPPIEAVTLQGVERRRDDPTGALGGPLAVVGTADSRSQVFTGLVGDVEYTFGSTPIAVGGYRGPTTNIKAAAPAASAPVSTIRLDEQGSGTYSLTDDNNGAHPVWRCEPGDNPVEINNGTIKIDSRGTTGQRQISKMRFGGVGKSLIISARGRVNILDSTDEINGTIPGLKLGLKFRCPQSTFAEDDWQSVRGYDNASPGSFIFLVGIGAKGRLQLPRNKACESGYESGYFTKDIGYSLGTYVERSVQIDFPPTTSSSDWRVRYWTNATRTGTPVHDITTTHPTIEVKSAYLWLRTDRCAGEWDFIKVEEVAQSSTVVSLPAAGPDASPLLSSKTNTAAQQWFIEPGSSQVNRLSNRLEKPSTEDYHRWWAWPEVGGPGKKVGIRFQRVSVTTIREFRSDIQEGLKPWFKWAADNEPNSGPAAVIGNFDDHIPGAYSFFGQTNRTGNDMISKRSAGPEGESVYTFYTADTRERLYSVGTVEDLEFIVDMTDSTKVVLTGYINGKLVVTAVDSSDSRCKRAGYLGARCDGAAWRVAGAIEVFTL